jgi:hypothetical protein
VQYIGLLAVVAACGVLSASKVFNEGEVHWWPLLCTLVKGYLFYKGVYYLRLQNYVDTVQRPHSRVRWAACTDKALMGSIAGRIPSITATAAECGKAYIAGCHHVCCQCIGQIALKSLTIMVMVAIAVDGGTTAAEPWVLQQQLSADSADPAACGDCAEAG